MVRILLAIGLTFYAFVSPLAEAQLDASSAVLLRGGGKAPQANANELDSSRYRIRAPESRRDDDEIEEKPGTLIPSPVPPVLPVKKAVSRPAVQVPPKETGTPAPVQKVEPAPEVPVTEQVRQLLLGGDDAAIDEYRKQVHPSDPRANVVDISIAPAYFYNSSQSSYSFRRYHSDGPGFVLGMNFWATPFFGVQSKFFSSLSTGIRSGVNTVPEDLQNFEGGVRFRRHFGYHRKAPVLTWGFDYFDSNTKIGKAATAVVGRKSSGVSIAIETVLPTTNVYAHTVELSIRPRLRHSELATGASARSGTQNESNALGLALGGRWNLDGRHQLFWKGQYTVERNLFDGSASQVDPHSGQTPNGVSVTNSMAIFYFGLQWGS